MIAALRLGRLRRKEKALKQRKVIEPDCHLSISPYLVLYGSDRAFGTQKEQVNCKMRNVQIFTPNAMQPLQESSQQDGQQASRVRLCDFRDCKETFIPWDPSISTQSTIWRFGHSNKDWCAMGTPRR